MHIRLIFIVKYPFQKLTHFKISIYLSHVIYLLLHLTTLLNIF